MKKSISLVLVLTMIITLFIGCGDVEQEEPKVALKLWHYYNNNTSDLFDLLVQEFNETVGQDEGIIVDAYGFSGVGDLADAVFAAANKDVGAQEMPDIFASYSDNVVRLDELGVVATLDDYFTKEELESYRSEFLLEGYLGKNDGLKIIPVAKSTEIVFINATDFDVFASETGASYDDFSTWESLAKMAENYYNWTDAQTEEFDDGKAMFGVDAMANFMIVGNKQLGQDIYLLKDDKIEVNISEENARKMWDAFYVPFVKGHYIANGRFRSDDMKAGDLLAYAGATSSASYFPTRIELDKDNSRNIDCMTMPYPVFEGAQKVSIQQGAGMVVAKSTQDVEKAATVFLKWFTDVAQNNKFAASTGYMPVKNEGLNVGLADIEEVDSLSVQATIYTSIEQVNEYELYANLPFSGSFEARRIIEDSLVSKANDDIYAIEEKVENGEEKQAVLKTMTSEENFNLWYTELIKELKTAVK